MDKMPDRITDEVISNDPADVPDAVDKYYEVWIPITANILIKIPAENADHAIVEAKSTWVKENLVDIEYTELPEAEEL